MPARISRITFGALAASTLLAATAGAETLYFKNKRAIQADSWEIKGRLIYVTMAGKTVYMLADSVDWEGTEKIKSGSIQLEKVDYSVVDKVGETVTDEDDGGPAPGGPLTAADIRKVGAGFRLRRAASAGLSVEVLPSGAWTDSGVNLKAGQTVSLRSSGRITLGEGAEAGPEGLSTPGGKDAFHSEKPHGALLVRVGLAGEERVIGRASSFQSPADGRLYFGVNDRTPSDNSGSFTIRVELPGTRVAGPSGNAAAAPTRGAAAAAVLAPRRHVSQGMQGGVGRAYNVRDSAQGAAAAAREGTGE